jgi:hypothetical protein
VDALILIGQLLRSRRSLCVLAAAWGFILAIGLTLQASYDARPGETRRAAGQWPAASRLARPADRPIVLIFVHPRCPCTAATLAELREILDGTNGNPHATIVLPRPEQAPQGFCDEARDRLQAAWPLAAVVVDPQGAEAQRFGAATSGHILVFSPEGEQRFSGGITASRGHRGENLGQQALAAALSSSAEYLPSGGSFPVFGCALLDSATREDP